MKSTACLIGVGEMGGVFARGLLKIGCPVYPVTRGMNLNGIDQEMPDPRVVILSVGEKDLSKCLREIPKAWLDRIVLLQNELLPRDWQAQGICDPTVISVWFEKKRPQDYKVMISSPVFGPHANLIKDALNVLEIPCHVLHSEEELLLELVLKNLYILTINIAGLEAGGTVQELWNKHQSLARKVANDVLDIQFHLIDKKFDRESLIRKMCDAFDGDPQHKCRGRTAPQRLERAIAQADAAGLEVKTLRELYAKFPP